MSRRIEGLDVERARKDGAVWGRTAPGRGWQRLGFVTEATDADLQWGWVAIPDDQSHNLVQARRQVFMKQRVAITYVVREAIFLGLISPTTEVADV